MAMSIATRPAAQNVTHRCNEMGKAMTNSEQEAHTPNRDQEAEKAALFGPPGRGEYAAGDIIRFRDAVSGQELTGEIDYIRGPAPAIQGGKTHPTVYVVDVGDGSPHVAYQADIIMKIEQE